MWKHFPSGVKWGENDYKSVTNSWNKVSNVLADIQTKTGKDNMRILKSRVKT